MVQCLSKLIPDHAVPRSFKPAFEFIASPIQRLFYENTTKLSGILQILCIFSIRFRRTYIEIAKMKWHRAFNDDVSFIKELLDSTSPDDFARTLFKSDLKAFLDLSPQNIVNNDKDTQQYQNRWDLLSFSVWESCLAFPSWIKYILQCAQVSNY